MRWLKIRQCGVARGICLQRAYPTSLQQENRRPGEDPLQLRVQVYASAGRERDRGMEAEVPPAQHRDAQDGAARIGEGHPRVRSAVSVVENDQREGQEPQYQGVHGQAEVHPITLPSRFIGNRGVNLPDEVKKFLCHHSQEPLQNLPTYTPPHLTLLHTLHVSYNKAYHITHFPHYR